MNKYDTICHLLTDTTQYKVIDCILIVDYICNVIQIRIQFEVIFLNTTVIIIFTMKNFKFKFNILPLTFLLNISSKSKLVIQI